MTFYFTLGGGSAEYYLPPPNITIVFYKSAEASPMLPTPPTPTFNDITLGFACSQAGMLYWAIGVEGEVGYVTHLQIMSQTI
jgi:hypothetical protein